MFPTQLAQIQAVSGALDKLLARASRRVDAYCRKRIVMTPATTIATGGGIGVGATSVNLTSTLGYDNGQETAVVLGTGTTQEMVPVSPGGVAVSSWAAPYPGSLTLARPTAYAHLAGETVQGVYQEVSTVGSADSSDVASEAFIALDQAAQIARAHEPALSMSGTLTRLLFLKCYPIVSLLQIEHMLPFDTSYGTLFPGATVGIAPSAGYVRLPLGSFVLPEGLIRTTYTAGYANVPDEIAEATALFAAAALQQAASGGAYRARQGKRDIYYGDARAQASLLVQDAERMLQGFKRLT
jgi:hypothetical protein